jgi:hypothetical protein
MVPDNPSGTHDPHRATCRHIPASLPALAARLSFLVKYFLAVFQLESTHLGGYTLHTIKPTYAFS